MNIEIRKLTPDLAEDYVHFFDVTPHDDNTIKDELPCYCVTWRSDDSYVIDNRHWFSTREERRDRAIQFVRGGYLQGYLAYCGDEIVGWCNATADCQGGVNYLRSYWPIEEYRVDVKVKSIFCFVIAPKMQRKGIATQLVERICKDAAGDGFDFVEAYVNKIHSAFDYRGPLEMYEKCGFTKFAERDGRVVVRKALK
ncbi:MAG TPA: GNAT family N-acetyltransferase [Clostridia bacterium]|nr:GNAT family N-acetyltransferase [Clostridia bacterium]